MTARAFHTFHALAALAALALMAFGSFSPSRAVAVPVTSGLIHLYEAEGNSNDSVGTAHGSFFPSAYAPGVSGQAFDLDGISNPNVSGLTPVIPTGSDFTVALWVKDSVQSNSIQEFISAGFNSNNAFYLGTNTSGGSDEFRISDNWISVSGPTLQGTGWHHYAVTKTAMSTKFYIDGSLHDQRSGDLFRPASGAITLKIGTQFNGFERLIGQVDDVAIYNRALDATEVATLIPEPSTLLLGVLGFAALA